MSKLQLTLVQANLVWENKEANRRQLDDLVAAIDKPNEVIVFPEMFTTGFSMRPELFAEHAGNETLAWLTQLSANKNMVICGSLMFAENGAYYNRFIWMQPKGSYMHYDKSHLFSIGEENIHYKFGGHKSIIQHNGWRIMPVVCYDLRFPVWLRRTANEDYDLMLVVANWPDRRIEHWKALLIARAIENQCYVVAVNRVGVDGNGVNHPGDSMVISPKGEVVLHLKEHALATPVTLDLQEVLAWREAFPAWKDADVFSLKR